MKRLYCVLVVMVAMFVAIPLKGFAGDGEGRVGVNAGFLFPSTLNASLVYEKDLSYGNAFDLMAEIGNHWQTPVCHRFWKGYYWDAGFGYKIRLKRYKNSMLRFRLGGHLGASQRDFFMGCNLSLEYDYVLPSGVRLCISQKNDFNFFAGDHFRNGLMLGIKFPL